MARVHARTRSERKTEIPKGIQAVLKGDCLTILIPFGIDYDIFSVFSDPEETSSWHLEICDNDSNALELRIHNAEQYETHWFVGKMLDKARQLSFLEEENGHPRSADAGDHNHSA
jgi:hypothetical protein